MSTIEGFSSQKVTEINELGLTTYLFRHDKSGAEYLHIASDDTNNACCIAIRTYAENDKGIPHVLEHIALCGSKKYPIRDPFFSMLNRSQNTFMNAMTSSNATYYPFSTQNHVDFRNLFDVYFECVFNPLLKESSFWQEGFRLECTDKKDINSRIIAKGVVFNEMKGDLSSVGNVYSCRLESELMPTNTYKWNSGGIPFSIMDLNHCDLLKFHQRHYHPANALFVTYGNIPLEINARMIDDKLRAFSRMDVYHLVDPLEKWAKEKKITFYSSADPLAVDPNKCSAVSTTFLLEDNSNIYTNFCLEVVSCLLVDGDTSPFYEALITPQLGADFSWRTGFANETKDSYFSVGLQGIAEKDVDKVVKIIKETLKTVARDGFTDQRVENILHHLQLTIRNRSKNYGINLINNIVTPWSLRSDYIGYLQINGLVDRFRADYAKNPDLLKNIIKKYFINNSHKLTLTLKVDEERAKKEKKAEKEKLELMVKNCCREVIYDIGQTLDKEAAEEDDISILPCLSLSEIERTITREDISITSTDGATLFSCVAPANGLVYFQLMLGCNHLSKEDVKYLPILCDVLTRMGTRGINYKELSLQMESFSSAFCATPSVALSPFGTVASHTSTILSNYCLSENIEKCLALWSTIINELTLNDCERLGVLVKTTASELADSIPDSGHRFAMSAASAIVNPFFAKREVAGGLSYVALLKNVIDQPDKQHISDKLKEIADKVFNRGDCRVLVTSNKDAVKNCMYNVETFLNTIPAPKESPSDFYVQEAEDREEVSPRKLHYEFPFDVNYTAKAISLPVNYTHSDTACLKVLAELLSWKYLHGEIREKGGAYGAGALLNGPAFCFYSYRDPNNLETFDVFEKSVDWVLAEDSFSEQDIMEAKLAVFQKLDAPVSPSKRGTRLFTQDIDDDMFQQTRENVFATTKEQLIGCAGKYLKDATDFGMCIIGPESAAIKQDPSWSTFKI